MFISGSKKEKKEKVINVVSLAKALSEFYYVYRHLTKHHDRYKFAVVIHVESKLKTS